LLSAGGSQVGASVSGQTYRKELPDVLRLAAEVLREPTFPATELDLLKRQRATSLETSRTDPQSIASRALARHGNPYPVGDVRYAPTVEESIANNQAVTRDDVAAFHRGFYGASNAEIAIVGDFDPEATRALVTQPLLVLADEPTANLDSETAGHLIDLMVDLNVRRKVTFLFSTHDEKLMGRVARVVRIRDGALASS
jgi:predicted Zn-dependent peptidase